MANFLDSTAEIGNRLSEYASRLQVVEAHLRRGERRAARARLDGLLEELVEFARDVELPVETIVVGAQLGFFSGGELFRGRIPGALLGAAAGWLYGQQVLRGHREAIEALAERVAALTILLEVDDRPEELAAQEEPATQTPERVTLELDREPKGG